MLVKANTLDDLLREVLETLLKTTTKVKATRGESAEVFGAMLHLTNPRARFSRSEAKGKLFSALGELFWYLSGDTKLDFIDYYIPGRFQVESDDGQRVRSGYGDRLFSHHCVDQIRNVIRVLRDKRSSRRAVIQLFDATDLTEDYKSIPCTCTLQFAIRDNKLSLFVSMRSNDAFFGLPHDVFSFTMIQEIVARSVEADLGEYKHCAGSLHLYDDSITGAQSYVAEAWQSTIAMPAMPAEDPWAAIAEVRRLEAALREGSDVDIDSTSLSDYWKDLARLLRAFAAWKSRDLSRLEATRDQLTTDVYKIFIQPRIDAVRAEKGNAMVRTSEGGA
jgi:thymidylate synthase